MAPVFVLSIFIAVLCSVQGRSIGKASFERSEEDMEYDGTSTNSIEEDEYSASTLIEKANRNLGQRLDEPLVMFGDIAVDTGFMNADPCTARGCKWQKSSDGNVYVPFVISNEYSARERAVIEGGLQTFAASTCIRFFARTNQRDFVDIQSQSGCFSFIGRRGNGQVVSLSRQGCVFLSVVQHELLHALGFNHEQTRSDRDSNVQILIQNVIPGMEFNFRKINTINLGTPYDYNSVMHYSRFAFSRNRQPTILPIPDNNAVIGRATQMSPVDILRINRLYNCTGQQLD
ncbi:high choriolytic enzyme 1-like [Salvelinus fontinalis]|uniref:high choriolytic enzyme 1-like n=1 Tax=Salvelinus fontinalis TaxID=8038 RepID=UPI0024853F21|nr:high choriolytic enzyme 1-like [Salvelinus fontinalis]XP_055754933.1 high choriolytic enzyme 1-like [Salvelinus fontinalis]